MRCVRLIVLVAVLALPVWASDTVWVLEVSLPQKQAVDALTDMGLIVDDVREGVAVVYATSAQRLWLDEAGFAYQIRERQPALKSYSGYTSYDALSNQLAAYAAAYPGLCRVVSVGQSVEGRELWAMLITDSPDTEEDEPEVRYAATMHGDEPVGMELCLGLIGYLLENYTASPRIRTLVDETALWVLPLMNPDGYEAGTRFNATADDLNRSFPAYPADYQGTFFAGESLELVGRPLEVQHMMQWATQESFTLAANFHTGALVINYPYDEDGKGSRYSPTPDEMLFRDLSRRYSRENPPMWASPYFADGITNGADWYAIFGSMQDWHYRYLGCFEVTIELSDVKQPSAAALPQLWQDNLESMLAFAEAAHIGLRGVVTDTATGEPVYAKVLVEGNPQPVFTDPEAGDYHRLLLPGSYTPVVAAPGYITRRLDPVVVPADGAVRADAALHTGDINGDGVVTAVDVQLVILAVLEIKEPYPCDVDGGGLSSTDVQAVVWRGLDR
jgi:hypothetical protein